MSYSSPINNTRHSFPQSAQDISLSIAEETLKTLNQNISSISSRLTGFKEDLALSKSSTLAGRVAGWINDYRLLAPIKSIVMRIFPSVSQAVHAQNKLSGKIDRLKGELEFISEEKRLLDRKIYELTLAKNLQIQKDENLIKLVGSHYAFERIPALDLSDLNNIECLKTSDFIDRITAPLMRGRLPNGDAFVIVDAMKDRKVRCTQMFGNIGSEEINSLDTSYEIISKEDIWFSCEFSQQLNLKDLLTRGIAQWKTPGNPYHIFTLRKPEEYTIQPASSAASSST